MSQGSFWADSDPSSLILPRWGSMRSGVVSAREPWAPAIAASGSSSWPTATVESYAQTAEEPSPRQTGGTTLPGAAERFAAQWPTPNAHVSNNGEGPETWHLRAAARNAQYRNTVGLPLTVAAVQWQTPNTGDAEHGGPNSRFGRGNLHLTGQAVQWGTPAVADTLGGHTNRSKDRSGELLLKGQAFSLSSRLDPTPSSSGEPSSPSAPTSPRRLNPLFVEWLMGLRGGWTDIDLTGSGRLATALWRSRQARRLACLLGDCGEDEATGGVNEDA